MTTSDQSADLMPCEQPLPEKRGEGKKDKKKGEGRRDKGPIERALFLLAWIFLVLSAIYGYFYPLKEGVPAPFYVTAPLMGLRELTTFLYQHLISAMIPAFFVASAISTFFSKETIIKTLGKNTNPLISYPLAALAGAILTVCSCGILPIFMSILQSGAGIGPAITFLYASPAINLISIIYTWRILPSAMLIGRISAVFFSGILIGFIMHRLFSDQNDATDESSQSGSVSVRSPLQEWSFFGLLILVMITSTDVLSFVTNNLLSPALFGDPTTARAISLARVIGKLLVLGAEILVIIGVLRAWFTWDETRKWLKRTWRQASDIMPMVFLGIFYSGFLGGAPSLVDYLGGLRENTIVSNLMASFIGAMLYFGSIVGVNVVDLFMRWGLHKGPALALLLSGPSVSLPSILALIPILGKQRTGVFLALVILVSALCGLIFGSIT